MRKIVLSVLLGLLLLTGSSLVQAQEEQEWVNIPIELPLHFDGTDGQELGQLDFPDPYLRGKNCIRIGVEIINVGAPIDGKEPEMMFTFNQVVGRLGENLLLMQKEVGNWIYQFPIDGMKVIDPDLGHLIEGTQYDSSATFDYMLFRTWNRVIANVWQVAAANFEECEPGVAAVEETSSGPAIGELMMTPVPLLPQTSLPACPLILLPKLLEGGVHVLDFSGPDLSDRVGNNDVIIMYNGEPLSLQWDGFFPVNDAAGINRWVIPAWFPFDHMAWNNPQRWTLAANRGPCP